ncbi:MAG: DUF445 domain-containing protein [Caulobacteraceae bacterium]
MRSPGETTRVASSIAPRATGLRRMRAIATGLLAVMTAVFVASRTAPAAWVWPPWLAAFAEAAMVGALADWFAVTALFRRPLGLPIPHTAIVPRNKDRIGAALGDFIAGNFLTPRLLDARLKRLDPAAHLASWLESPGAARGMAEQVAGFMPEIAASSEELRDFVGQLLRRGILAVPAAPFVGSIAAYLVSGGRSEAAMDRLIVWLTEALAAREGEIRRKISEKSWRWLPRWVDQILADKILAGLSSTLREMRDPAHPWRVEIRAAADDLIARLGSDEALVARGEALKRRWLDDPAFLARMEEAWTDLTRRLADGPEAQIIAPAVERALIATGHWLAGDRLARDRLNGFIRVAVRRLIAPRREAIGGFVAQVVAGWDAKEVVARLELQVGADLQYIRINGTIVGGLAGLAIHGLTRLLW